MSGLDFLPFVSVDEVSRWNKEWMQYFSSEPAGPHVLPYEYYQSTPALDNVANLNAEAVFNLTLAHNTAGERDYDLHIWVPGRNLLQKAILEIGCGCGLLGKELGLIASSYLGLDYSRIALAIARGVSPANCRYLHISDRDAIKQSAETMDVMVGREFFIHQNFANALWVIRLGKFLLRPGGTIHADFYWPDPSVRQGVLHPCRAGLDPQYPSCAFLYSDEDVKDLARETGVSVESIEIYAPYQRKFVTFKV